MKQNNSEDTKVFGITIKKGGGNSGGSTSLGKFGKKGPAPINPETFTFTPKIPKVNVIPAELNQKYEVKGVIRKTAVALVALAVVFAGLYGGGVLIKNQLNSELTAQVAGRNDLANQVTALGPYQDYKTAVGDKRNSLSGEVSTDLNYGEIYNALFTSSENNGVSVPTVAITQGSADGESGCINPDPFNEPQGVIGCITFEGTAGNASQPNQFVNALVDNYKGGYKNPFISSISTNEEGVSFSGTISFTDSLYSNKYAELALPLEDLLAPADTEGTPVEGGNIDEVTFNSTVTMQAKTLVPSLAEENLTEIDNLAVAACTPEGTVESSIESIKAVLVQRLPADDTTLDSIVAQLTTVLTNECAGE